jgi:Kef-type K+ transport system membrane component KefB
LAYLAFVLTAMSPGAAAASELDHGDPIAPVILSVTALLFFALIGRFCARQIGQPSVLGEITMGILIGNVLFFFNVDLISVLREGTAIFKIVDLTLQGHSWQEATSLILDAPTAAHMLSVMRGDHGGEILQIAQTVDVFSRYGVIFLLFLVGLESSLDDLRQTSGDSLRVAVIGLISPVVLGFVATLMLMPSSSLYTDLFIAATLGATSIGITASVLKELNQLQSREANIILGAAVIDDILGLILLTIVTGITVSGSIQSGEIATTVALASLFLLSAFVLSPYFLNTAIRMVRHMDVSEAKLFVSFLFVMILAWLANLVGLATIVGAFAAGLILHDAYFKHWGDHKRHHSSIKDLVAPLEAILVPIFFVLMGIQVKLETFFHPDVALIGLVLLVAAIAGKLLSGLGVRSGASRTMVGIGMMPRGEVGLVFASVGKSLDVIDDRLFSAVVMMIIVTTILAPPLLKRVRRP